MSIESKNQFLNKLDGYLKGDDLKKDFLVLNHFYGHSKDENLVVIEDVDFIELDLHYIDFSGFSFKNCRFDNNEYLRELTFRACIFTNCTFNDSHLHDFKFFECDLINTTFRNSVLTYFLFADTLLQDVTFDNCLETTELYFGGCDFKNMIFKDTYVSHSRFEGHDRESYDFKILFKDCMLDNNQFLSFNLSDTLFRNNLLGKNTFSDCTLKTNCIDGSNSANGNEFSFIDFQTILKSETLKSRILEKCFGIKESVIKDQIKSFANKVEYQTIFISYSFHDREFATRLNDALRRKGISTFMWEKDAPGGRGLKKIMKENVKKHDRLLFIASKNSIKSKACHFELSEGRKKQEELWQEILFPIHIDNFLFEVEKEDIRPMQLQDEFWQNILELKEINSLNFCDFKNSIDYRKFDKKVIELIKGFKK